MDADQVLAFRLARSGLARREAQDLPSAAACPASDFARDAALLALAARTDGVTREAYDAAVDAGDLVVAHVVRGAIHAVAPGDLARFGRALLAAADAELAVQLGQQVRRLCDEHDILPTEALDEVTTATKAALAGGPLSKNDLHAALRERVGAELMPWCKGCGSHHVAPMLWRYATIGAGGRLDAHRRYLLGRPGPTPAGTTAVERFLHFYAPATVGQFADWAGLARPHAARLWEEAGVPEDGVLPADADLLAAPPTAEGVRLLPPGDPHLAAPNRPLLAPDEALRKRMFRPVASPGAVLRDGRLAGLWRAKANGRRLDVTVERLEPLPHAEVEPEAERVAALRGAELHLEVR